VKARARAKAGGRREKMKSAMSEEGRKRADNERKKTKALGN
jgi:hypothetical protein